MNEFPPVDFRERVARRKLALDDEWQSFKWEAIGNTRDTLLTFGITRPLKSGKNKGKMTWRGTKQRDGVVCCVTDAEYRTERIAWERETGKCSDCFGSGKHIWGYSVVTGAVYQPCKQCGETGNATEKAK